MKRFLNWLVAITAFATGLIEAKPTLAVTPQDHNTYELTISIPVPKNDSYYADYMNFSVDQPGISLSSWKASVDPVNAYDDTFKVDKKSFTQPFTITMTAHVDPATSQAERMQAYLHISYYQRSKKKIIQEIFPLPLANQQSQPASPTSAEEASLPVQDNRPAAAPAQTASLSWSQYFAGILQTSESLSMRVLLSLLLGILMSLTPCIYPMIPITMGILQAQGSRSVGRSFCLASSYTMGIATTFAALGVTAAFTGKLFGSIMNNPVVIITIVGLLAYLGLSMLGLYNMYIPSWLQPRHNTSQEGSLVSAFAFGAASGTIASPCLSPGLLLLLTLVTSLGSIALGFILLFSFGLGLGLPLLIVGTFSNSLNLLPRAGMWMIEVKQFFGFIMLATCLYFLNMLLPASIMTWLTVVFVLSVGIFYIYNSLKTQPGVSKQLKNGLGLALTSLTVVLVFKAYQTLDPVTNTPAIACAWCTDYEKALLQAKQEHKKLLLDISAPYCSICKAIDKKVFCNEMVACELNKCVPVKIENIEENESTLALQKKFNVVGVPTILLIDPENEQVLHRWGSDLYDTNVQEFVKELRV